LNEIENSVSENDQRTLSTYNSVNGNVLGSYDLTHGARMLVDSKPPKPVIGNARANNGIIGYDHNVMMASNAKSVRS
jgi:hypothetical protein